LQTITVTLPPRSTVLSFKSLSLMLF